MYLDHALHVRLSLSEITSLFGLSRYLDQTFAQRTGSAKVKSKSEVAHCTVSVHHVFKPWSFAVPATIRGLVFSFFLAYFV